MAKIPHSEDIKKFTKNLSVFEKKIFFFLLADSPSISLAKLLSYHHNRLPKAKKNIEKTGFFKFIDYEVKGGKASLTAELETPFVYCEKEKLNYTGIRLEEYARLRTKYAMGLYELLRKFKKNGKLFLKEEDFKAYLGVPDNDYYSLKCRLVGRIIKPAIKQIQDFTSIEIDSFNVEDGIVSIRFKVKDSPKVIEFKAKPKEKPKKKKSVGESKKIDEHKKIIRDIQSCSVFSSTKERVICEKLVAKGVGGYLVVESIDALGDTLVNKVYKDCLKHQATVDFMSAYVATSLRGKLKEHHDKPPGLIEHEKRQRGLYTPQVLYDPDPKPKSPKTFQELLSLNNLESFKKQLTQ